MLVNPSKLIPLIPPCPSLLLSLLPPTELPFTSTQLLPQIILNHRRRSTTGLKPAFMLLWAAAGCPLAVYNIVNNFNIALIIQPQILTALSLVTWGQCCVYGEVSALSLFLTSYVLDLMSNSGREGAYMSNV